MDNCITITDINGEITIWYPGEWEDYQYNGDVFVIKNDIGEWIGIYNMKYVNNIVVGPVDEGECDCEDCECEC